MHVESVDFSSPAGARSVPVPRVNGVALNPLSQPVSDEM